MSNVYSKKYLDSLDLNANNNKNRKYEGLPGIKKYMVMVMSLSLVFALYVGYVGPKINPLALLFVRIMGILVILQTVGSLLLYINTGVNVAQKEINNGNRMIQNILGVKTTYLEKILQEVLMILKSVLVVIIAIRGKAAHPSVFHFFALTALVSYANGLYLLYLAK